MLTILFSSGEMTIVASLTYFFSIFKDINKTKIAIKTDKILNF